MRGFYSSNDRQDSFIPSVDKYVRAALVIPAIYSKRNVLAFNFNIPEVFNHISFFLIAIRFTWKII